MQFWAAFFKTRPKKTQPEDPRFCSEGKLKNTLNSFWTNLLKFVFFFFLEILKTLENACLM